MGLVYLRQIYAPYNVRARGFKRRRPFMPDPTSCVGFRKKRRKEKLYEVQSTVVCYYIVHKSAPLCSEIVGAHNGTYKGKKRSLFDPGKASVCQR